MNPYIYEKRKTPGGNFIYLSVSLLESDGVIQHALINYGKKVIHALGVQIGAAHCEIMMTPVGPILVEMGASIHGGKAAEVGGLCTANGQIDLVIDAYLSPDAFHDKTESPYQLKQVCKICFLTSKQSGTIVKYRGIDRIRELKSFYDFPFLRPIGASLEVTTDLFNAPGVVILVNSDPDSLEHDYCELRTLNTKGIFLV